MNGRGREEIRRRGTVKINRWREIQCRRKRGKKRTERRRKRKKRWRKKGQMRLQVRG